MFQRRALRQRMCEDHERHRGHPRMRNLFRFWFQQTRLQRLDRQLTQLRRAENKQYKALLVEQLNDAWEQRNVYEAWCIARLLSGRMIEGKRRRL